MSRRTVITAFLMLIAFGLGAGAGVLGLLWSTGRLDAESTPVEAVAPTLSLSDPVPTPAPDSQLAGQLDQIDARLSAIESQLERLAGGLAAPTPATPTPSPAAAAASQRALYRIDQEQSQVRFLIDEVLGGNPTTVTATTRRAAGDVIVDFGNPPASQVGTIAINARTFRTDNEFRDDSIRGLILQTDTYEIITFAPTALRGLPEAPVAIGQTVDFEIVGDLTIKNVTREVTFSASVTLVDETRIEGLVRAQVLYPDFGITVRTPPLVTDVSDEVTLELEFVALRVES